MKKNILYIWHRRPFTNVRSPLMRERCIFPQEMYSHEKDLFFLFLREICHILFQNNIQLCIPFLICKLAVYTCHLPGVAGKSQQSFLSVRKIVRIPGTVLVFWSGTAILKYVLRHWETLYDNQDKANIYPVKPSEYPPNFLKLSL